MRVSIRNAWIRAHAHRGDVSSRLQAASSEVQNVDVMRALDKGFFKAQEGVVRLAAVQQRLSELDGEHIAFVLQTWALIAAQISRTEMIHSSPRQPVARCFARTTVGTSPSVRFNLRFDRSRDGGDTQSLVVIVARHALMSRPPSSESAAAVQSKDAKEDLHADIQYCATFFLGQVGLDFPQSSISNKRTQHEGASLMHTGYPTPSTLHG